MIKPNHSIRIPSYLTVETVEGSRVVMTDNVESASAWDLFTQSSYSGPRVTGRVNAYQRHTIRATCAVEVYDPPPAGMLWGTISKGAYLSRHQIGVSLQSYDDYSQLSSEALGRLNESSRGGIDLSVDLLQARETAALFRATVRVHSETLRFQKRIWAVSARGFRGVAKRLSSHYLEYIYGIKPALQTVYGIAEQIHRRQASLEHTEVGKAKSIEGVSSVQVLTCYGGYSALPFDGALSKVVKYSGTLSDSDIGSLGDFTSLDPASIAWELLPWSFVADWFYDVGGYLRNLETAAMLSPGFVKGFVTTSSSLAGTFVKPATGFIKMTSVNRQLLHTWPRPELPKFSAVLGSSRLLAAGALITQALPRFK